MPSRRPRPGRMPEAGREREHAVTIRQAEIAVERAHRAEIAYVDKLPDKPTPAQVSKAYALVRATNEARARLRALYEAGAE